MASAYRRTVDEYLAGDPVLAATEDVDVCHNYVCTAVLDRGIPLRWLSISGLNVSYDPSSFSAAFVRERNGRRSNTTLLTFGPGKVVAVGAKSKEEALVGLRRFLRDLHPVLSCGMMKLTHSNRVCSINVGRTLSLDKIREVDPGDEYVYFPDGFPGLTYRIKDGPVIIFYDTGQIIQTGIKKVPDGRNIRDFIREIIRDVPEIELPEKKKRTEMRMKRKRDDEVGRRAKAPRLEK